MLVNPGSGGQDLDWSAYPGLLTGYHLAAFSPAIDAGKIINDNGGQDFWENALYNGKPDIGAHENPDVSAVLRNDIKLPDWYALLQNYPNPFNPETRIYYQLPEMSKVDLEIYDLAGRRICTLEKGRRLSAGIYSVVWDGKNESGLEVASGIYIYRLLAAGLSGEEIYHSSRKMLLIK
jgi:hypothetical protein